MKYILLISAVFLGLWGCGTTVNTALMGPGQRLDYAVKLYNNEDYQEAIKEYLLAISMKASEANVIISEPSIYWGLMSSVNLLKICLQVSLYLMPNICWQSVIFNYPLIMN